MLFITEQRPDLRIYSPQVGHTIVFADGRFETDDPVEITALRRNRYVTEFTEAVSPAEVPTEPLHRDELYELAQGLEIEGRSKMDRDQLAAAVDAAQAAGDAVIRAEIADAADPAGGTERD